MIDVTKIALKAYTLVHHGDLSWPKSTNSDFDLLFTELQYEDDDKPIRTTILYVLLTKVLPKEEADCVRKHMGVRQIYHYWDEMDEEDREEDFEKLRKYIDEAGKVYEAIDQAIEGVIKGHDMITVYPKGRPKQFST